MMTTMSKNFLLLRVTKTFHLQFSLQLSENPIKVSPFSSSRQIVITTSFGERFMYPTTTTTTPTTAYTLQQLMLTFYVGIDKRKNLITGSSCTHCLVLSSSSFLFSFTTNYKHTHVSLLLAARLDNKLAKSSCATTKIKPNRQQSFNYFFCSQTNLCWNLFFLILFCCYC